MFLIFSFFLFSRSEYKSKYYNSKEEEHLARHKSLSINLGSYVQVCAANNNTDKAFQSLLFYRNKYKQYKLSIYLYNIVLDGFAEKANLAKINEVLGILEVDNIKCNAQSYAAIFQCLGRSAKNDENLELLRKFQEEASNNVNIFILAKRRSSHIFFFAGRFIE